MLLTVQDHALTRRPTVVEGLYTGLGSGAALTATQLDAKMKLLVEAPAAVEDALASLLDHADATLQALGPPAMGPLAASAAAASRVQQRLR